MKQVVLMLPFPPTLNHYYGSRGKQRFIKAPGVRFRAAVWAIVRAQRIAPFVGPVRVRVELFPDSRRRMDIMNREKALSDSLTHAGVWRDDSQIDDFRIVRREVIQGGAVRVRVRAIRGEHGE